MCLCARAPLSPDFTTVSDYNDVFFSVLFSKSFHGTLIGNTKPKNKCYHCARPNKARPWKVLVRGPYNNLMEIIFYSTLPYDSKPVDYYVLKLHSISYFCLRGQFAVCILSKPVLIIRRKLARICTLKMPFLVFLNLGMLPWTSREKNKVGRKMHVTLFRLMARAEATDVSVRTDTSSSA